MNCRKICDKVYHFNSILLLHYLVKFELNSCSLMLLLAIITYMDVNTGIVQG